MFGIKIVKTKVTEDEESKDSVSSLADMLL